MRKLILEAQVTVDGYYTDINGNNDWQLWNWGADWPWDDKLKKYFTIGSEASATMACGISGSKKNMTPALNACSRFPNLTRPFPAQTNSIAT